MIEHEPVDLLSTSENLAAMTTGVIAHAVDQTNGLWLFQKGGSPLLLSAWGVDIADKVEVFTLTVTTLEQARAAAEAAWPRQQAMLAEMRAAGLTLPFFSAPPPIVPPAEPQRWPFAEWHAAVLRRREGTVKAGDMPKEWYAPGRLEALRPGEVPPGTRHSCWVTLGLIFTGETGERLLAAPGSMPFSLLVTSEGAAVDAFAAQCEAVELNAYLATR